MHHAEFALIMISLAALAAWVIFRGSMPRCVRLTTIIISALCAVVAALSMTTPFELVATVRLIGA